MPTAIVRPSRSTELEFVADIGRFVVVTGSFDIVTAAVHQYLSC